MEDVESGKRKAESRLSGQELLEATGGVFKVRTYRDGNRRRPGPTFYFRADTALSAELRAKRKTGIAVAVAFPWNPRTDALFGRYIVEVAR